MMFCYPKCHINVSFSDALFPYVQLEPFVQLQVPILPYSGSFLLVSVATQSKLSARAVTDLTGGSSIVP